MVLVILAFLVSILWLDTDSSMTASEALPASSSPAYPKIDYQTLIAAETGKAKTQTDVIVKDYKDSLAKLDTAYEPKFLSAASSASAHASSYGAIAELIGYLAWDKVKGTSEADTYLSTLIDPSVSPVLADFHKDVNAETEKFDYELRKVTVQLATNIAAIGPGDAIAPTRLASKEDTSLDFQGILKSLGRDATAQAVFGTLGPPTYDLLRKSILPKLIKPLSATAGRTFTKQIAKVAALPVIASASGPIPIGPIVALLGAAWTGYDIYRLSPDFKDEVYVQLKTNLDEIRTSENAQALESASIKWEEIRKIQIAMGSSALDEFSKQEVK